jgi:hypothetical protein
MKVESRLLWSRSVLFYPAGSGSHSGTCQPNLHSLLRTRCLCESFAGSLPLSRPTSRGLPLAVNYARLCDNFQHFFPVSFHSYARCTPAQTSSRRGAYGFTIRRRPWYGINQGDELASVVRSFKTYITIFYEYLS